jgi:predicted dienelactone hydrolase
VVVRDVARTRHACLAPEPTGAFAVGRTQFAWANPGGEELAVWAWYPAARSNRDASADYLPPPWRQALRDHQAMLMRSFFKHDPQVVRTHSRSGAVLASDLPAYPLVILRAGGNALTTDFTTLAEDLASHGYIVVGFDAPQRSFVIVQSRGRAIGCRSRGCMRRSAPQIIFRSAIKAC